MNMEGGGQGNCAIMYGERWTPVTFWRARKSKTKEFRIARKHATFRAGVSCLKDRCQSVFTLGAEVGLHAVAAEPATHLTAGTQKSHGHARPVVLQLHVPQRIGRSHEILGADVRHAVRGPTNFYLSGKIRRRGTRLRVARRRHADEEGGSEWCDGLDSRGDHEPVAPRHG